MGNMSLADIRVNYTAADAVPVKLFLIDGLVESIRRGYIPPVHVSLSPTNKCNQNCPFCSYSARDKTLEMDKVKITALLGTFVKLGAIAIDWTGGGEPLIHPHIELMLNCAEHLGYKQSLTTNGQLRGILDTVADYFTWIRISVSDYSNLTAIDGWENIFVGHPKVDFNFSYVLTRKPEYERFAKIVDVANKYKNVTHVRAVNDLLDLEYLPPIEYYAKYLKFHGISDNKVIYQDREKYQKGAKKCLISLLRPNIDARGFVYPCCGTQYAIEDRPARDFAPGFNMGSNYEWIWKTQAYFDGNVCTKCYYGNYNILLNTLQNPEVKHIDFV